MDTTRTCTTHPMNAQAGGPDKRHAKLVETACREIETSGRPLKLKVLAAQANLSPFHFHRVFKSLTGLTPREYAASHRAGEMRRQLAEGRPVTEAIYESGFGSDSRFYEVANRRLGMKPTAFKSGGAGMAIHFAIGECSLGSILVAQTSLGVCAILLGDDANALARQLQDMFPRAELIGADPDFECVVATVVGFVEAPSLGLDLPLDIRGTAFQERVWKTLREIPVGSRINYTELAQRVGAPQAVRAVASACAANRIAVAIPCHRVVRSDGGLSGYRWGVERKHALLERESEPRSQRT